MTPRDTLDQQDRAMYDAWVQAQLAQVYGYELSGFNVWDASLLARAGYDARPDEDAYRGPWRSVRPYVTAEFREWIETGRGKRFTFTEWKKAIRAEREAERVAIATDPAEALDSLAYLRDLLQRRGRLIVEARERGASWDAICEASGLSRTQAYTLARAESMPF